MESIKATPKTQKSPHSQYQLSSNSRSLIKEQTVTCQSCFKCINPYSILCYSCCFTFACEHCFTQDHFINCQRQFNKHTFSLFAGEKSPKKYGKHQKKNEKCKRCEVNADHLEYCEQCKQNFCFECSQIVHNKGKFINHSRTVSSSPEKLKKLETVKTQNIEEESFSRKSIKANCENIEYGFKAGQKLKNPPPMPMKKGRGQSIAKNPFDNQQNTPIRHRRKNSMAMSDAECKSKRNKETSANLFENPWLVCSRHCRIRNILTQACDLICFDCYQEIRSFVSKLKTVEWQSWFQNQLQKQTIVTFIKSVQHYANIKSRELKVQFDKYRQQLQSEFIKKKEILQQRYRANLSNLQKWHHVYSENLNTLTSKCQLFTSYKDLLEKSEDSSCKHIPRINKVKSLIIYEEINKMKKQFGGLQDQYQFKVTQIGADQFEEILKSFSFVRKKAESESTASNAQKMGNKMGQSAQLRQSRISNSSMTSDRKYIKRQESMTKSSYYQISHLNNLVKRSASREGREDIPKDISQRILFPSSGSDRKELQKQSQAKTCNIRQKNSYFFQNPPQDKIIKPKDTNTSDLGFKDVKYINLETVITEKLEKVGEKEKKDQTELSTPVIIDQSLTSYTAQMTEEGKRSQKGSFNLVSDARLIQSITVNQGHQSVASSESRNTVPHLSIQAAKNKRKSDYMQMRDRLRKPSIVGKVPK